MIAKRHLWAWLAILACSLGFASTAAANNSGSQTARTATSIRSFVLTVAPNVSYTITTSRLVPDIAGGVADTVLHVQNLDDRGTFAFGNDNVSPTDRSSRVDIPAAPTERKFKVIVRASGDMTTGRCDLTLRASDGATSTENIHFAGTIVNPGDFVAQTHFWTGERPKGSTDTILLLIKGDSAHAIAFDDDDGVDDMSWVSSPEECLGSLCQVVIGNNTPDNVSADTDLYWDGDVAFMDADDDGLGATLEGLLGLDPQQKDSDGDGLPDGLEVIGAIETETPFQPPLKLHLWGADPTIKDVFVEVDWGPPGTDFQMQRDAALANANSYPPQIRLHLDTGLDNDDLATMFVYGDWGGARRVLADEGYNCGTLDARRKGVFHHFFAIDSNGGGKGDPGGSCMFGGSGSVQLAHELGHNLGVAHGGRIASPNVNCKPHYRSFMNYAYAYRSDVGFSNGGFLSRPLTPTAVDESVGLNLGGNLPDVAVLNDIAGSQFKYKVDFATGKIDWNRDGEYQTGPVRAAVTMNYANGGCEATLYHLHHGPHLAGGTGFSFTWLGLPTPRLYLVGRRPSDGKFEFRSTTSFACAPNKEILEPCETWTPAVGTPGTAITNAVKGPGAPALAASGNKLVLVYLADDGKLRFQIGTPGSDPALVSWSAPALVSGETVLSEPEMADVAPGNGLRLFARHQTGVLRSWDFNSSSMSWGAGRFDAWSDGGSILLTDGVGVTKGHLKGFTGLQTIGVFPESVVIPPNNDIESRVSMARFDAATGLWVRLPSVWPNGRLTSKTKLSIAYEPYDKTVDVTSGRFYLTYTTPENRAMMAMTEGNDPTFPSPESKRLQWLEGSFFLTQWAYTRSGLRIAFDLARDENLRAAWSISDASGSSFSGVFYPFADGIVPIPLNDNDDVAQVISNVSCSIKGPLCSL